MKYRRSAFTLIELLIVVAIIAILAVIATPNFLEAQTRAKVARSRADMRSMVVAVEAYAVDYNSYPLNGVLTSAGSIEDPQRTAAAPAHKFLGSSITSPVAYLTGIPEDVFVDREVPPHSDWTPYYRRYFYTNLPWFAKITEPSSPPVIALKIEQYGAWIMAAAGPDRDRLDLAADLRYDPSNGTVSNGDIIFSPKQPAQ